MRLIDADKLQEFPIRANRCPNEMECPVLLSDVVCVPWCEYLEDSDGDD